MLAPMRTLFLTLPLLIACSCNNNGNSSHHRSYVISKSTETAVEADPLMEEEEPFIEPQLAE